jgi:hypothetical protein
VRRGILLTGLAVTCAAGCGGPADDPWPGVPVRPAATPHDTLVRGTFTTRAEAVGGCLECHGEAPGQLQRSAHADVAVALPPAAGNGSAGAPVELPGPSDCLACHALPELASRVAGTSAAGAAAEMELRDAARRVVRPAPANCLACHDGGPSSAPRGVHLTEHGLGCTDCHRTVGHRMPGGGGRATAAGTRAACTDCHAAAPHPDDRLDRHGRSVACATCHLPLARVSARYLWYRDSDGSRSGIGDPAARIWPVDSAGPRVHGVAPAGEALGCRDCHTRYGPLDWGNLGYSGDPAGSGGRSIPDAPP